MVTTFSTPRKHAWSAWKASQRTRSTTSKPMWFSVRGEDSLRSLRKSIILRRPSHPMATIWRSSAAGTTYITDGLQLVMSCEIIKISFQNSTSWYLQLAAFISSFISLISFSLSASGSKFLYWFRNLLLCLRSSDLESSRIYFTSYFKDFNSFSIYLFFRS